MAFLFSLFLLSDSHLRVGVVLTDSNDFHVLSVKSLYVQQFGNDSAFMPQSRGKTSELKITLVQVEDGFTVSCVKLVGQLESS